MTLRHRTITLLAGLTIGLGACGGETKSTEAPAPKGQPAPQTVAKAASTGPTAKDPAEKDPAEKPAPKPDAAAPEKKPAAVTKAERTPRPARVPAKAPDEQPELPPFEGHTIAVVHTSNMVGEIEPCG